MRSLVLLCVVIVILVRSSYVQTTSKADIGARRPVTVKDAIAMTVLGDPQYFYGLPSRGLVAQFSPDGKHFISVLRRGNLARNVNEYTLLLWETSAIFRKVTPRVLLRWSSSSNRPAIEAITWRPDNETLAFLGEHPNQVHQLYTLNIRTGALKQITDHLTSLITYSIDDDGDRIAYVAEDSVKSFFDSDTNRAGYIVSTEALPNLIADRQGGGLFHFGKNQLFFKGRGSHDRLLKTGGQLESYIGSPHGGPVLSPDGRYIVLVARAMTLPESWKEYSDPDLYRYTHNKLRKGQASWVLKYELIDTRSGRSRALLNAPVGVWGTEAIWSNHSHSVAVSNVYLPFEDTTSQERKLRQSTAFAAEVDIRSGSIVTIGSGDLKLTGWDRKTGVLSGVTPRNSDHAGTAANVRFRKNGAEWEIVTSSPTEDRRPDIILEEGMNTPPRIVAVDSKTGQRRIVLDLNPQFRQLELARVEEIHWNATDGHGVTGGLYYPPDYRAGRKYPLVIQTHAWNPTKFWIDGPWTSGYAAQALAGRGFMVVQMEQNQATLNSAREAQSETSSYEGVIDFLDQRGLIDRNRVGLYGFSRTCYHVKYALTQSRYRFAAASVMEGFDGGYFQYLQYSNYDPGSAALYESVNGSVPLEGGLNAWIRNAPDFNADKTRAPLRIIAENSSVVLFEWEWFALLYRLEKAVEMVAMKDGDHILQKPFERMIAAQGNVDWFDFWLQGREDPDPAKGGQYTRWRELRKGHQLMQTSTVHRVGTEN